METVSYRAFDSACRRAEKRSMAKTGQSFTGIGSQSYLMKYGARIVSMYPERKTMEIEGDWRTALKHAAEGR